MTLGTLILTLIIIGVLLYLVNSVIPMVPWMKTVINVVVALVVILWIAQVFGISTPLAFRLRH